MLLELWQMIIAFSIYMIVNILYRMYIMMIASSGISRNIIKEIPISPLIFLCCKSCTGKQAKQTMAQKLCKLIFLQSCFQFLFIQDSFYSQMERVLQNGVMQFSRKKKYQWLHFTFICIQLAHCAMCIEIYTSVYLIFNSFESNCYKRSEIKEIQPN